MRSDAGQGLQPERQSDRGFRALLALAVRPVESSAVQARALGQDSGARHVDEQVRPGDDLPAAGSPAAGPTATHLPVGERHHVPLLWWRCRGRIRRVSHHPDRRPRARQERGVRHHLHGEHRGTLGGRHARARLDRVHRYDMDRARRLLPFRSRCMSSRSSRVRATPSCTTSRSKTPRCCWSRGCSRRERCGATRIPTRAFCGNEATARPISRPKRRPHRFGIREESAMANWIVRCVVVCGALLAGVSLQAHHSLAGMYALGKEAKVTGAFKAFRLINPHSSLKLDVKGSEAPSPSGRSSAAASSSSRGSESASPAPIRSRPGTRSSSRTCRRSTGRVRSAF